MPILELSAHVNVYSSAVEYSIPKRPVCRIVLGRLLSDSDHRRSELFSRKSVSYYCENM